MYDEAIADAKKFDSFSSMWRGKHGEFPVWCSEPVFVVAVRQYADICLFSTAQYKCPVAQLEAE